METPSWKTHYFAVLSEAAESASQGGEGQGEGWLQAEMRRQLDLIADAMHQVPSKPYTNEEHDAARNAMLAFPGARIPFVRCEVARATGTALPNGCS